MILRVASVVVNAVFELAFGVKHMFVSFASGWRVILCSSSFGLS